MDMACNHHAPDTVDPGAQPPAPAASHSPHWFSSSPLGQCKIPSHHREALTQVPEEPHSIPDTMHLFSTAERDSRQPQAPRDLPPPPTLCHPSRATKGGTPPPFI